MSVKIDTIRAGITNSYLIQGEDGTILIDPGEPGKGAAVLRRLKFSSVTRASSP